MFKKRTHTTELKRQRTQIDGRPNKTFSYYANRSSYEGTGRRPRSAEQGDAATQGVAKGAGAGKILLSLGVITGLVLFVGYNTTLSTDMNVQVNGKPEDRLLMLPAGEYQQAAQELLHKKLTNKTKLTANTTEASRQLLSAYPELVAADIVLPLFGRTPALQLTPTPIAAKLTAESTGRSYVLSPDGRAISTNTDVASAEAPTIIDQAGLRIAVGAQVLPRDDMRFITRLTYQLRQQNLSIESLVLPPAGRQLHVRLTGVPYLVKFSLEGDVLQQAGAYHAVQKRLKAEDVIPAEYVDVRVGDRAYYK